MGDTKQVHPEPRVLVWIYLFDTAEVQALHTQAVWSILFSSSTSSSFSAPWPLLPLPFVSESTDLSFLNFITREIPAELASTLTSTQVAFNCVFPLKTSHVRLREAIQFGIRDTTTVTLCLPQPWDNFLNDLPLSPLFPCMHSYMKRFWKIPGKTVRVFRLL